MMCLVRTLVQCTCTLLTVIVVINADNFKNYNNEQINSDINTEFNVENNWRAISKLNREPEELIVPYDVDRTEITVAQGERYNQQPKRRRVVRKRKRRPSQYMHSDFDDDQEYAQNSRVIRSRRPSQYLRDQEDFIEEHWQGEAFAEEQFAYKRPYHKRRRPNPIFVENLQDEIDTVTSSIEKDEETVTENKNFKKSLYSSYNVENNESINPDENSRENKNIITNFKDKSYRKPYSAYRNKNNNNEELTETTPNLKTLLKQNEGSVSLVELLQEKNLSLSDLLKGKENAISALQQNSSTTKRLNENIRDKLTDEIKPVHVYERKSAEENENEENSTNRRLPPTSRLSVITKVNESPYSEDQLAMKEYINAQRKRLSSLRIEKENRAFSQVKQVDVVTEATTEKRIFIPSKHFNRNSENVEIEESTDSILETKPKPESSEITDYDENNNNDFISKAFDPPIPYSTASTKLTTQKRKSWTPLSKQTNKNEPISKPESISTTNTFSSTTTRYINSDMIIKENGMAEKRNRLALKPRIRLPLFPSNPLERKITTTSPPATTTKKLNTAITRIPANAFAIDIKEIAGINDFIKKANSESENDGPLRISMKINNESPLEREEKLTTPSSNLISNNNDDNKLYTIFNSYENALNIKDELMEILKDSNRRARLAKILSLRNMTFAELIALRERGSSQVHLADIFHNKSKEPIPSDENIINTISRIENKTFLYSFPISDVTTSSTLTVNNNDDNNNNRLNTGADFLHNTSLINTIPSNVNLHNFRMPKKQNIYVPPKPEVDMAIQSSLIDVLNQQKIFNDIKQSENVLNKYDGIHTDNSYSENTGLNQGQETQGNLRKNDEKLNMVEENFAEEIHPHFSINPKEENLHLEEEEYMQLSSGVRSAIFASSAIIAGSIIVFMSIFLIFKWQQKRRQIRYNNNFNALRGRFPILQKSVRKSSGSDTSPVMVNVTTSSKNLLLNSSEIEEQNQQYLWNSLRNQFP